MKWNFCTCLGALMLTLPAVASDQALLPPQEPKILGANSCSSSSCHGGGGSTQNQFQTWSVRDFHSHRPFATLTTARSKQIANALEIQNPATDARCTSCHAPLNHVPLERRQEVKISEGVSCESCHGPAEHWLRGHTRSDWTRADRTAAGMRDLKNLYERANTCVACHQTVELPLLRAGHPELIFELDGQMVSQPRHWRESTNFSGAQAWFIGQAVALRELSWQISREGKNDPTLNARWQAAWWLLQNARVGAPISSLEITQMDLEGARRILKASDEAAQTAAKETWPVEQTRKVWEALISTGTEFRRRDIPRELHARRAERLVLALDRLKNDLAPDFSKEKGEAELNALFQLAQSIPDFDPEKFAGALDKLAGIFKASP